ncbi:response regulator [Planktothrix sp. FACHB-1355]|uniref:Circadian input-output histidine kinase CikA n=1 Tax=Aerosakkonema funiforme FACHB-1375 TaxID=2949571 RepID=A0A926ZI37_9CYAN|nr:MULTISPECIES: hybrid sensor histidine kinase/response regulator [Oscillatoriales]MBD2183983.1 response regulator [Aerosakkonema funiforme FACHB-1375]MBD3562051.1 response regulator [Planktothrix sp. FACHB-1355]
MSLNILVIDDNPTDRLLIRREIEREFAEVRVKEITNDRTWEEALTENNFDVVVTDYQLGWNNGLEILKKLKSRYADLPVIMFTNSGNEEIAVEAMKSGLDDYIIKAPNRYIRVPIAIRKALKAAEIRRRTTQLEAEREQLLAKEKAAREDAEAANRLKDEFLANLSHELRTPLNSMLGWAQMLRLKKLNEHDYRRAVETIERNTKSLARLIEDLLDVSRIITGNLSLNFEQIELAPVIEAALNTVRPVAETKAIDINFVKDLEVQPILGDASRLQQIMWNLLSNAVKFTPRGGSVEIRLSTVIDDRSEEKSSAFPMSCTQIRVSDTGQGIEREFLPYVFDRFRQADSSITRSFGGLGLGLAIVRHLVELHGGTVKVESPGIGKGATFTVQFPLPHHNTQPTNLLAEFETTSSYSPSLSGVRIVLVDDDADTRDLLQFVIEQYRAEVKTAASVREALALLQEFPPNVLISDIGMTEENGYDLIRQVKEIKSLRQIPTIALTAYAGQLDRDRILSAGFQMHLPKPIEPDDLVGAIALLVGRI